MHKKYFRIVQDLDLLDRRQDCRFKHSFTTYENYVINIIILGNRFKFFYQSLNNISNPHVMKV